MKTKLWRSETKVGIMIIIAAIILSVMLIRASHWRFSPGGEQIIIRFDYVGGLLKSAPVHMYGTEIGKVASVSLVEDGVEVEVQLYQETHIRDGYQIFIDILGLVGEKYVEILNGPVGNPLTKDAPLKGINPISIGNVLMKADEITDKTLMTMDFLQSFISTNEKEIRSSIVELNKLIVQAKTCLTSTICNVDLLLTKIGGLTETAEGDVAKTAESVRTLTNNINGDREEIAALVKNMANDIDQLIDHTAPAIEKSLDNLQKTSNDLPVATAEIRQQIGELSGSASELMAKLNDVTDSSDEKLQVGLNDFNKSAAVLSETVDKIDKIVADIEDGQGTLGKLIKEESGHKKFADTMDASKRTVDDVGSLVHKIDKKVRFFDTLSTRKGYELSYVSLSKSLQNQFALSSTRSNPNFYLAGLSIRGGKVTYDFQVGRKFGILTARGGSIRSRVGAGLDYWFFDERMGLSLTGLDITGKNPEIDMSFAIRLLGGWYFTFGAEDLSGPDIGYTFGIRTEIEE